MQLGAGGHRGPAVGAEHKHAVEGVYEDHTRREEQGQEEDEPDGVPADSLWVRGPRGGVKWGDEREGEAEEMMEKKESEEKEEMGVLGGVAWGGVTRGRRRRRRRVCGVGCEG